MALTTRPPAGGIRGALTRGALTRGGLSPARLRSLPGFVAPLVAAASTLAVVLVQLGRPSYWTDEAATVSAVSRPLPDMLRVFDRLDLVHATYYLLMRPWADVFGIGEWSLRMPSALAAAAASAGLVVLGRRLGGTAAGLAAGLAYGGLPTVSRYAQEARSYSLVAAVAVLASYLLLRGCADGVRRRGPWLAGYTASVLLLGMLNLDALLLVPAHLVTLALARRRETGLLWRWLIAAVAAGAGLAPFVLAAAGQRKQVEWLKPPNGSTVVNLAEFLAGTRSMILPVAVLAVVGAIVGRRPGAGAQPGADGRPGREGIPAAALAVPWLLLPPAVLLAWSFVGSPVFLSRYVFFCVPALALLVGLALARVARFGRRTSGRWLGMTALVATVALLADLSLPHQGQIRRENSRLDLRLAADVLRQQARPGDTMVFLSGVVRWGSLAYPDAFRRVRDVGLAVDPVRAGNYVGVDSPPEAMLPALAAADRVWIMSSRAVRPGPGNAAGQRRKVLGEAGPWRTAGVWASAGVRLTLLVRTGHR
ncbi:glycosyltransferase family 39 protein [Actinomadura gamaensis]|uniref:Glycosyltransferase family 39 protein n=1 Tax=Actinomadura gamaensis TaxID=1763541 RepID=A0ABV9UBN1_9ACTN